MIKRIKTIQDFHIFHNFEWGTNLDDFKQYNLIYGWNGSGKTTLSKFLRQIELREVSSDCEGFNVLTESGSINERNISESSLNLKVFNQDFVKENIFTDSGEITPIFYLGRKDIATKKLIESLKNQQSALFENEEKTRKDIDKQKKGFEKFCSEKAKGIRDSLRSAGENKYNNYDSRNFKAKCSTLENEEFIKIILPQEKLDEMRQIITSKSKEKLTPISSHLPELTELESIVQQTLITTVVSNVIERLNGDSELSPWINQGLSLLKNRELEVCPFCNQQLPANLVEQLEGHFNNEFELFIQKMDHLIVNFRSIKEQTNLHLPSKSDFYEEISYEYEKQKKIFLLEIGEYSHFIDLLVDDLNKKRNNPFAKFDIRHSAPQLKIKETIDIINKMIVYHNAKTDNFTSVIQEARRKLEDHFVAENLEDYLEAEETLTDTQTKYNDIESKSAEIYSRIIDLEKKIVEQRTPAEEINSDLRSYLGHEEIKFDIEGEGYQIIRNGAVADALSEGEKTAVSFIYFLKTLHDKDFDFSHSVIVIDDPISSLDSNSLYNAFSFLKNRTEGVQQLFVLTHNYSFFKEVKNWLVNPKHPKRSEKSSLYMLKNTIVEGYRVAELHPLDDLLKKYTSEYHYLFSLVYKNATSSENNLKNYYLLPNVSRRLLESFFAFRFPTQIGYFGNQFAKIKIDEEKKTRILRYTDANSHSDHIRADTEGDLSYLDETPQVLTDILELIKKEDEKHFNEMISIINKDST
jgi:wobble nucleotide-excising tRNase